MGKILLVSGTDTGVGKTFVSCLLLSALRERGFNVAALKPVETGCSEAVHSDAEALRLAAGGRQRLEEVVRYCFTPALAPHLAAQRAGTEIPRREVVQWVVESAQRVDLLLVEGAGGLMVPFGSDWRFIDLVQELQAPVLLVVGSKLGAINHATLSFEALHTRGLTSPGYVLNEAYKETSGEAEALTTNQQAIAEQAARYFFTEICYMPRGNPAAASERLRAAQDRLARTVLLHCDLSN